MSDDDYKGPPRIFKPRKPRVQGPTDTRKRLQAATRFFARPVSFDAECPHCGTVYTVRANSEHGKRNWDPWTARFECTTKGCARTYVVGMLFWPVSSAPGVASMPPRDQVPNHRQIIQLRKEGGGWWMADYEALRLKRTETTNLTTDEERPEEDDDADDDTETD